MNYQTARLSVVEFNGCSVGIRVSGEAGYTDRLVFVGGGSRLNLRVGAGPPFPYLTAERYQTFAKVVVYNADGTEAGGMGVMPGDSIIVSFS